MNEQPEVREDGAAGTDPVLTEAEVRVLGCLVEKSVTTPEYYPLSLNAIANACNQKSSRHPVVEYDEDTVQNALDGLRDKRLASLIHTAGGRTPKYRHQLPERYPLEAGETALLCVLMLRGPQTVGELRGRSERLSSFSGLEEVEQALQRLAGGYARPLAVQLPRPAGGKESRWAHLLGGPPAPGEPDGPATPPAAAAGDGPRRDALEEVVEALRNELADLRRQFEAFRAEFR